MKRIQRLTFSVFAAAGLVGLGGCVEMQPQDKNAVIPVPGVTCFQVDAKNAPIGSVADGAVGCQQVDKK
jgi:hypothetical protein